MNISIAGTDAVISAWYCSNQGKGTEDMNMVLRIILMISLTVSTLTIQPARSADNEEAKNGMQKKQGTELTIEEVPEKVREGIKDYIGDAKIIGIEKKSEDGKVVYVVEIEKDGKEVHLKVNEKGKVLSMRVKEDADEE
jgi:hypothetical protein